MEIPLYNFEGERLSTKQYPLPVFQEDKGRQALKETLTAYFASARQGNAKCKNFGEVNGTGKKPYRQKGTGSARHGSKRSPIWRGGAVVFGPRPRSYNQNVTKRTRQLGLKRALFDRASEGKLVVLDSIKVSEPKTRLFSQFLTKICPTGSILMTSDNFDPDVLLAARNIARLHIVNVDSLNAWDLVRFDSILITESGLNKLLSRFDTTKEEAFHAITE